MQKVIFFEAMVKIENFSAVLSFAYFVL